MQIQEKFDAIIKAMLQSTIHSTVSTSAFYSRNAHVQADTISITPLILYYYKINGNTSSDTLVIKHLLIKNEIKICGLSLYS